VTRVLPRSTWPETAARAAATLAVVVAIAWAFSGTEFDLARLAEGVPRMGEFLARMVPPDMGVVDTVATSVVETLQIAILGTAIGAVFSFLLALAGAANLAPPWVHQPVRWLLAVLRAIPVILLALLFVASVGLGPFPGVLALALHSTGMLGKFYAESFENARRGPIEALESAGASWAQRVRYGVITQTLPDLARDTLFRFEMNLRESLVLGLVGAGGIGFYIQLYTRSFQYDKVATLTVVVLALVVIVEQASVFVRARLR
jgi:phosphonate transport system permease protein